MGILREGAARAVVVPELSVLSPDKIVQEIILRDLRARGATVISANEDDHRQLEEGTQDRVRMVVRDVLMRLDEHEARFVDDDPAIDESDDQTPSVIVELISPPPQEPLERIRPVR